MANQSYCQLMEADIAFCVKPMARVLPWWLSECPSQHASIFHFAMRNAQFVHAPESVIMSPLDLCPRHDHETAPEPEAAQPQEEPVRTSYCAPGCDW